MIGRKKKRQQDKNEEDEEGSLHKNGTLLAYQNKQLFTLVNQLQEDISKQKKSNETIENNFKNLCEIFNYYSSELNKMNDALKISLLENKIEFQENNKSNLEEEKKKVFSSSSEILNSILSLNEKFDTNQSEIE
jgi:hypothetical protein